MDDSTPIDAGGNASEDLEDLLAVPVSKDYINCVWTNVPNSGTMDLESSPKKLVIADATSEEDVPNGAASDDTGITAPVSVHKDPIEIVESSGPSKRKKVSKAKKDQNPSVKTSPTKAKDKTSGNKNISALKRPRPKKPSKTELSALQEETIQLFCKGGAPKSFTIVSHQEKIDPKSELASKTNGLNDIVAAADKNLFAAYKNLVVQRSLPQYAPKQVDSRFFSGNFFNCRACGDKYVLQSSFLGHMSRKTARFSYKCPTCKVQLCFDNRCNFLLHITSHGMDADDINPGDLIVLPLVSEESECEALFKNTSANYISCSECSKLVSSLKLHLQGSESIELKLALCNIPKDPKLSCKQCALVLPTKCSFSAHERFHKGDPPYLCPECGELFLKSSTLLKHMEDDCLHDTKRTVFQCGYCRVVVVSLDLFTEHLVAKHLRPMYKCHVCGVSVGSFEDFNVHRGEKHNLPAVEALSGAAALCAKVECDKCPGVSLSVDSLHDHAVTHTLDPTIMSTVFQCQSCQCMFGSKQLMLSHKSSCQGKAELMSNAPIEISYSELFADVTSSFQSTVPSEGSHTEQQASVTSERASVSGNLVSSEQIGDNKIQLNTAINDVAKRQDSLDKDCLDKKPLDRKKSVGVVAEVPGAARTGQKQLFNKNVVCKLCKKVVSVGADKAVIKRHFASYHFDIFMKAIHCDSSGQLPMQIVYTRSKDAVNRSDKEIVDKFLKTACGKGNFVKIKSRMGEARRRKSRVSKLRMSPLKIGAEMKQLQALKTDGFQCYKCLFSSEDVEAFRTHILLHKSNPSDVQCPECGLCFIVRPPLEKHLIAEHGIKKVDQYLEENGFEGHISGDEEDEGPIVQDESDSEEPQGNQCKVCREKFESSLLLERHFRVHGGAFLLANLKAKRLSQ